MSITFKKFLEEFKDIFPKEMPYRLPTIRGIEHQIDFMLVYKPSNKVVILSSRVTPTCDSSESIIVMEQHCSFAGLGYGCKLLACPLQRKDIIRKVMLNHTLLRFQSRLHFLPGKGKHNAPFSPSQLCTE
ncbi:hypothetical protein CR513_05174, partial [Mucuna pruriens]